MEMNTRLQVEHPVTELITGIDLVEWQLNVARGERLPADRVVQRGAAVEARLYAEDPAHDYLPSVGRITHLEWPALGSHLRLDTGVEAGDEVSAFYDPMLGKVIAWGETRARACDLLLEGLGQARDRGGGDQSRPAQEHPRERGISARCRGHRFSRRAPRRARVRRAGRRTRGLSDRGSLVCAGATHADSLWSDTSGWRPGAPAITRWQFGDVEVRIETCAAASAPGTYRDVSPPDQELRLVRRHGFEHEVEIEGRIERAKIVVCDGRLELFRAGGHVSLRAARTEDALQGSAEADSGSLVTPLPGTVVAVHVTLGRR